MKRFCTAVVLSTASLVILSSAAPAQTPKELTERGRYIITAIQACGCHTREKPDGGKDQEWFLAGAPSKPPTKGPPANVGWTNPRWKKLYAPNITPDPETGIGKWSEAHFVRAMRTGRTPEGRTLDPFMLGCLQGDHRPGSEGDVGLSENDKAHKEPGSEKRSRAEIAWGGNNA